MNILITGARAPIALEWAYRLTQSSINTIIMADSLRFPIGRFSKHIKHYQQVSPPAQAPHEYIQDIIDLINKYSIELIIPTCEEIFYLARFKHLLPEHVKLFAPDFKTLILLHDKFLFIEELEAMPDLNVYVPESYLITSPEELETWLFIYDRSYYILKPVFSRFGTEVIFDIKNSPINNLRYPIIAQQKLIGQELCSYSIAIQGKIVAHSCYHPKYKAGPGAGIYFDPQHNHEIFEFTKKIVKRYNYTGQIAFDFIQTPDKKLYPIECNPRGTSGLHLIQKTFDLLDLIKNPQEISLLDKHDNQSAYQVSLGMLLFARQHSKQAGFKKFICDYRQARDIYQSINSGSLRYWQLISFFELFKKSLRSKKNLQTISTHDIAWNGDEII